MHEDNHFIELLCGLVPFKNEDGEIEFLGTDKEWKEAEKQKQIYEG